MEVNIEYDPNDKQVTFHSSSETLILYGGAKGGGKSYGLCMDSLAYALEYPGSDIYLFRETYDDLEANIISTFLKITPVVLYTYDKQRHILTFYNGTRVFFRHCRNLKDAEKYQGRSISYLGIDEVQKLDFESIQELLSCVRSAEGNPVRVRFTANPGGKSHYNLKKWIVDATLQGRNVIEDKLTSYKIRYIPATVYDNKELMKNDPLYVKRLENLPESKKKAFLHGDWNIFDGIMYEKWSENIHVVEGFKIPSHWRKFISVDNGYTDSFAWYWYAVDEEGTVYCYREFTRDKDDPKLTYKQQAQKVLELSKYTDIQYGEAIEGYEKIDYIVAGHDAWAKHCMTKTENTPQGKCILDYYREGGIDKLSGFIKPVIDRRLGAATVLEYLEPFENQEGKLTSKVKIFKGCKKLIETLPIQQVDSTDPEKVEESTIDHWYDSFRYGLISYHVEKSKAPKGYKGTIDEHKTNKAKNVRNKRLS